jgi:hypothetical protein
MILAVQNASTASRPPNNRLQRTVMDKVPRHIRQRAAAEPERYAAPIARIASLGENLCT